MSDEAIGSSTAIGSLLRYIGGWSSPSGRGIFMFRVMSASFSAAAVTGLGFAYTTAFFAGPVAAVGFAVGSCIGYVACTYYYFRTTMETALTAFDDHPQLLLLHIVRNYPNYGFQKLSMETEEDRLAFKERLRRSLMMRCFVLSSWHTAAPAIEELSARREAALIAKLSNEE